MYFENATYISENPKINKKKKIKIKLTNFSCLPKVTHFTTVKR